MSREIDVDGSGPDADGEGTSRVREVLGAGCRAVGRTTRRTADRLRESARRRSAGRRRRRTPAEGVVHVEYSPCLDGDPDPGEIVWAWVPFQEDPTQGKDRPVVVIGRRGDRLVAVPLTTKRDDREAQVALGTGRWDSQQRASYARIWRMLDIDPGDMRREGAVLDPDRFARLIAAVDRHYDVRVPAG